MDYIKNELIRSLIITSLVSTGAVLLTLNSSTDRGLMMANVNDYCRFCNERLRNDSGKINHSKLIFENTTNNKERNIFERLRELGLTLASRADRSFRSCVKCDNLIRRLESALPAFRKWEEDEKRSTAPPGSGKQSDNTGSNPEAPPATSASPPPSSHGTSSSEPSDKRAQVTASKTQRTLKRICPKPPSPALTTSISAWPSVTEIHLVSRLGTTEPQEPASVEPVQGDTAQSHSLEPSVESGLEVQTGSPVPARTISINQELFEIVEIEDPLNPNAPHRTVCKEQVAPEQQERGPSVVQGEPEPPQNKEEQGKLLQGPDGPEATLLADKSEDCDEKKNFSCAVCHKVFAAKGSLKKHVLIHTGEYPLTCTVCGKGCVDRNGLKTHMMTHTGEKPFTCTVCGKGCIARNRLTTHMMTHTGIKPFTFTCEVCGKGFFTKGFLERHARAHTGEKPFTCKVCGRGFCARGALNVHTRTHTGEKPFQCTVCEKRFPKKLNLKLHMMTHTGEYTFHCTVCNQGCCQWSDLKKHMMIHTGEKSLPCAVCKKRFSKQSYLKRHMIIHTGADRKKGYL